jgi:hypothetical protein
MDKETLRKQIIELQRKVWNELLEIMKEKRRLKNGKEPLPPWNTR